MSLLSKMRRINKLLQKVAGHAVNFMEMAEVLKETITANVFVISRKGKILGYSIAIPYETSNTAPRIDKDSRIPESYNELLVSIKETTTFSSSDGGEVPSKLRQFFYDRYLTIVPIVGGGARLGTLVLVRPEETFHEDDLVLAEYGSTVVGMEIMHVQSEEKAIEARAKAVVQVAVNSLSYSELEAVEHIFEELKAMEGLLVASKIADRVGITRSVIVNALRKLESAGVIESRSLGMKGTYIKILNPMLLEELSKARY